MPGQRWAPFGATVLLSVVVLFMPASGTPTLYPGFDKLVHLGLFAALALTGRWAGIRPVALAVGLAVYAGASEVLQAVLPIGRDAELLDAVVDVVGVVLGLAVARAVTRSVTRPAAGRGVDHGARHDPD